MPAFVVVEKIKDLVDPVLNHDIFTLDSLSPNLEVMASRNSSKSMSRPSLSSSVIIRKIVGFFDSNPRLCMADLSYLDDMRCTLGRFFQWLQCQRGWKPLWAPQFSPQWVQVFLFSSWLVLFLQSFLSFFFKFSVNIYSNCIYLHLNIIALTLFKLKLNRKITDCSPVCSNQAPPEVHNPLAWNSASCVLQ